LAAFPADRPRLVEGPLDPDQLVRLVRDAGVDLFDSSWPSWLADRGLGFRLRSEFFATIFDPSQKAGGQKRPENCGFVVVDFNEARLLLFFLHSFKENKSKNNNKN
jgi:hypothetical protein